MPPSYISDNDKSRRAWFAHFDPRANRLNDAASKSSRNPIAEPMKMPSKTTEPLIQTFIALGIPRVSQSLPRLVLCQLDQPRFRLGERSRVACIGLVNG